MIHYIKEDCGDGSSVLRWFSSEEKALKYANHPDRIAYCMDGDGVTYGYMSNLVPTKDFEFDDDTEEYQ
jgi:hypothetical protein